VPSEAQKQQIHCLASAVWLLLKAHYDKYAHCVTLHAVPCCYKQDWVDVARIIDHTAVKPDGYDDIPEHLPDPDAVKPDVWDEVM
jgi:Calreticulin family